MSGLEALNLRGMKLFSGALSPEQQLRIIEDLRRIVAQAPLFHPTTRFGKKMSVKMTAAGQFGWVSDGSGYRYERRHPQGATWPDIPESILNVWRTLVPEARAPECCLINFYSAEARMGMHQDRDEADFSQPVVSISLGDDGLFRVGNEERGGKTQSVWLRSGDVVVMEGASRLLFHGVDRIKPETSTVLKQSGRINLTLRVVT